VRYVFDMNQCVATEIDGKLTVETEPEDANNREHAWSILQKALNGNDEQRHKAAAAIAMSPSREAAVEWFQECNEAHIPGDCPLCGAT